MNRSSINITNHAHYLTFSCYKRQQLLTSTILCQKLLSSWNEARQKGSFAIWAYVIMPEHVHLLVWPKSMEYSIPNILRLLKEPFARWVVKHWSATAPHLLQRVRVIRGKRHLHRFWQEGGGYDRNLHNWASIAKAIDYIEFNPVRRGLVRDSSDWQWSSARQADSVLVVDSPQIEAD